MPNAKPCTKPSLQRKEPPGSKNCRRQLYLRWWKLANGVKRLLPQVPFANPQHTDYEETLLVLQSLEAEQAVLDARLSRLRRKRRDELEKARDLYSRLVGLVHATLGYHSERLRDFGLKPRKRGGGARLATKPAQAATDVN
jgi:hypothetical protein